MKRRNLIRKLFLLALLFIGLVTVMRSEWAGQKVCGEVQRQLPALSPGLKVRIGSCHLEPLDLGVELHQIAVTLPGASAPSIEADRAEVQLALLQALWGSVRVDKIELERPRVDLDLSTLELPASQPSKKSPRCAISEVLQRVDIARMVISDGTVHLRLPGQAVVDLANVGLTVRSRRGVSAIRFTESGGKLTLPGGELPLEKIAVTTSIDGPSANLEVQRLQLEGGQVQVAGHGSVRNLCDPDLNLETNVGVPLDLVTALLQPKGIKAHGYLTVNATLSGKLDAPNAHAVVDLSNFDVNIDGNDVNPKELSASLDLHDDVIDLQGLNWPFPSGVAHISARIIRKGNWPLTATAEGQNIPFGELLNRLPLKHPWVDFTGQVKANVKGHLLPTPTFSGPATIDIADFVVRTRAWDGPARKDDQVLRIHKAHVDTDVNFTPDRIKLTRTHLVTERGDATIDATLSTDPRKGLDLSADLARFDLAEFGDIVGLPWSGTGSAKEIRITGPYGEQIIDGTLTVKDFSFTGVHAGDLSGPIHFDPSLVLSSKELTGLRGKTSFRGHGALDFSKKEPWAWGGLTVESGRIEDLLTMLRDVHWSFEMFDGFMEGGVRGTINLARGPVLAPTSDFDLRLKDLVCYGRPLGAADFKMHTQDGELIEIPDFTIQGQTGSFDFGGHEVVGGALDFHLTARDVPAPIATAPELEDWKMTGTLSGKVHIGGTQQQPEINGEIFGADLGMFGLPVGQGHVQLVGIGDAMQIVGPVGDDVQLWSRMRWSGQLPIEARLTFDVTDLYTYVPTRTEWSDVTGQLKGTLSLRGNMKDPNSYAGSYVFPRVEFTKGDYTEENEDPVRLDFHGDTYELKSFSFRGHGAASQTSQATALSISGTRWGKENNLALSVKGALDARLFETLSPEIDASSGQVGVSASIAGTQAKPVVVGALTVTRGKLKLRDFPLALEGLDGQVQFSQASIEIPEMKGTLNGGRLSLAGSVGLKHFRPASYDLRLLMDEAKFHVGSFPTTTLSGDLALTGKADDPVVSGAISVVEFLYNEDITLNQVIASATRKKLDAQTFTKRSKVVRFADLQVHLDGKVSVRNNLVHTDLKGDLSVLGDDAHPLLRGDIEAQPGGKAFDSRGNEFNLEQLLVSFRDSERITPEFDIHATTTARDYRISLHAYGTPDNTRTELSSSPELSRGDIVTLLTLGFTSQDRSTGGGNGAALGLGADVASSLLGLDRAAQHFVPKNKLLRDPSFRLTSTYSQALGSMQPTAQIEGKILSDQVRLRLQEPVVAGGRGFKMQGEYRFNEKGSVQVQLDRDNSDYNFPDVGADLRLRWEMK
jgi:translocation and assembly module TamB